MTIQDLILVASIVFLGFAVRHHFNISILAFGIAKQRTDAEGVALLDQTVVLRSIVPCRSKTAVFGFRRTYMFEFSSVGDVRYKGELVLEGRRLMRFEMEAYKPREPRPLDTDDIFH